MIQTKNQTILNFLEQIDKDFNPPLSSKVNLSEYVTKIQNNANLIIRKNKKGDIIGLLVVYCNDFTKSRAYIP